jgi:hypothetical protein
MAAFLLCGRFLAEWQLSCYVLAAFLLCGSFIA